MENQGDAAITLDKLLLGGRYNGGELPGGGYPDFTYQMVTLQPGQSHQYQGTFTITDLGNYGFFIAYYIENPTEAEKSFLDANNWNTCIELGAGLTDADRTRQITVEPSSDFELGVPFYSQRDPLWSSNLVGASGATISQIGCAMTSSAMVLKYYGVDTDPAILNQWLSSNSGYTSEGAIYWAKPAEYSNGKVQFVSNGGSLTDNDNWALLDSELNQGYPVIVQVDSDPSTSALDRHWVVVTGKTGSDYYINDPWDLAGSSSDVSPNNLLSDFYDATYDNTFFKWVVYHGTPAVDSISPTVDAFSVTPASVPLGNPFTISYAVSDTGGSGLKQVELWRTIDVNGAPDPAWPDNPIETTAISGNSYTGSLSDAPSAASTYWYGIHVVDNASNWAAEGSPAVVEVLYGNDPQALAAYWAPVWYQDVASSDTDADYITKFNFDGESDFVGNNSWENQALGYPLLPYIYYSVVETETHWFICYADYHPRDWIDQTSNLLDTQHENDMEGLLTVIKKDGTPYGRLICMVTKAHFDFFSFIVQGSGVTKGKQDLDGDQYITFEYADPQENFPGEHPRIYVESRGHGVFGSTGSFLGGLAEIGHWETQDSQTLTESDITPVLQRRTQVSSRSEKIGCTMRLSV